MILFRKCKIIKSIFLNTIKYFHNSNMFYQKIRNIGILAHIDAGKTTTTERMLFYSGKTRSLGEVHHGNTVTDFLAQERERGITICSAAVSFPWKEHRINLIDTPGHIDFTMEVEQSLGAVDGAIVILDASAGVEAQTITVWSQADRYKLPKIVFVNKMDRTDASFEDCLDQLKQKLNANPIPLQWPIHGKNGLTGIIDIISGKELVWDISSAGQNYKIRPLSEDQIADIEIRRSEIIDNVSGCDDELADKIISTNSMENISSDLFLQAIRRATINQRIVPVFLGSAYRNTGVQPLMDAVVSFFPRPIERNQIYDCFGNDFVGKVFKVSHDKQRGPLTLVRVLRGSMKKGAKITIAKGSTETLQRIYEPLADEYREVTSIDTGDIGVCSGLKNTVTGDLLVSNISSLKNAEKNLRKMLQKQTDSEEQNESSNATLDLISNVLSLEPKIPDAVYFCSVEPPSLSHQLALDNALKQLQREDPSLRVRYDDTTMQTVLGGMGELHLEIIKSRILTEYKVEAELGPLQIAYKETLDNHPARDSLLVEKEIAGNKQSVFIELSLDKNNEEIFKIDTSPEATQNLVSVRPKQIQLVKKGALGALERGPRVGGVVIDTQIVLHNLSVGKGTADSFVMATTAQCVQKILSSAGCRLLEPIMSLQIVTPSDKLSQILSDLGRRRAIILAVNPRGDFNKVVDVLAPLSELSGYSSVLRTISSGCASISMEPHDYAYMALQDEMSAIKRAQGLE